MLRYNVISKNLFFLTLRNFSRRYTKNHEWCQADKNIVTVGITDFAQKQLDGIVHVELPKIGDKFKEGDALGAIESVKTAADVYSPVDGVVNEVNDNLTKEPTLINNSPYSQGWYVKLKVEENNLKKLNDLMNEDDYNKFVESESH